LGLIDFDYLIVSNGEFEDRAIRDTVSYFHTIGIRKFIFTVSYDPMRHTRAWMLDRLHVLRTVLNSYRPYGCRFYLYADIIYSADVFHGMVSFNGLGMAHSSHTFVRLPVFCDCDQTNLDLNDLCFGRKRKPILTAFENQIKTCSAHWVDQVMGSRQIYCALDLNYFTAEDTEVMMADAIRRECNILPAISHSVEHYPAFPKRMSQFKNGIGTANYTKFCRSLHILGRELFPGR
jgi:hypothetical protein